MKKDPRMLQKRAQRSRVPNGQEELVQERPVTPTAQRDVSVDSHGRARVHAGTGSGTGNENGGVAANSTEGGEGQRSFGSRLRAWAGVLKKKVRGLFGKKKEKKGKEVAVDIV